MVFGQILPDWIPLFAQDTFAQDIYDSTITTRTIVIPCGFDRQIWQIGNICTTDPEMNLPDTITAGHNPWT